MKVVSLCGGRKCCPCVVIKDNGKIEIGESGNSCELTHDAWVKLKELIKKEVL